MKKDDFPYGLLAAVVALAAAGCLFLYIQKMGAFIGFSGPGRY